MASLPQLDEESLTLLRLGATKPSVWVRLIFWVLAPRKSRHLTEMGNAEMSLTPCPTVLMKKHFPPLKSLLIIPNPPRDLIFLPFTLEI